MQDCHNLHSWVYMGKGEVGWIIAILKAGMDSLKQISTQLLLTSHVNTGLKINLLFIHNFPLPQSFLDMKFSTPTPRQKCNFGTLPVFVCTLDPCGWRCAQTQCPSVDLALVSTSCLCSSLRIFARNRSWLLGMATTSESSTLAPNIFSENPEKKVTALLGEEFG